MLIVGRSISISLLSWLLLVPVCCSISIIPVLVCSVLVEETGKGNALVKETYDLLKQSPLNFIGNVEGRDVYKGDVDVIVCDGFVGNISLENQ